MSGQTTVLRARTAPGQPTGPRGSVRPTGRLSGLRPLLADLLAMGLLAVFATLTFTPTFGPAAWRAALGGALLGVAVGLLALRFRLPGWATALTALLAYLVFGGALAMPATATWRVLPNPEVLAGLLRGLVQAWKSTLTVDPPIGETGALLAVPLVSMLAAGVVSVRLARGRIRGRSHSGAAWAPWVLAAIIGILFGLHTAVAPAPIGLGLLLSSLVWTTLQRTRARRGVLTGTEATTRSDLVSRLLPLGAGALVLAIAGGAALLALPALQPLGPRLVLRDLVEPPLDVHAWPSPLQGFRANAVDRAEETLMTVDGLPAGARIRVATLDVWDGVTYNVSDDPAATDGGTFRRIGDRVLDPAPGRPAGIRVTAEAYQDVWVPTVGDTTAVRFSGAGAGTGDRGAALKENFFLNRASQTALTTRGLRSGDQVELQAVLPDTPPPERIGAASAAEASLPAGAPLPDQLTDRLTLWTADAGSDAQAVGQIASRLRQGYYSHGTDYPSLPGHSAYRIERLFADEVMVGDEEQYAVAMALLVREAGMPARVVYGFAPAATGGPGPVAVKGADVSAWVEVKYDGIGWVSYQPSPPKDREPPTRNDPNPGELRPQVENPPPPPERPEKLPPDETDPVPPKDQEQPQRPFDLAANLPWILGAGIPLLVLVLPAAAIVGAKLRRRRGRRLALSPVSRVSGGWAEVLDRSRDLGVSVDAALTRREAASVLDDRFARASEGRGAPGLLAWRADASVFGTGAPSVRQAEEYWEGVREVVRGMARSRPWPRRLLAAVSLRSLRKP